MQKTFPVSILVDYTATPGNRWQAGLWQVTGVVAGGQQDHAGGPGCTRLHPADTDNKQALWSGYSVELHKDDAESYYFNIVSDTPRIFVICTADDEAGIKPLIATLSYDEAASYMEADEIVESVAMPAALYRWVEAFVLEHYVPEKKKKRKRDNWKEDSHGRPPGP